MPKKSAKKEKHAPPPKPTKAALAAASYRAANCGKFVLERRLGVGDPWVAIGRYDTEAEGRTELATAAAGSGHCESTFRLTLVVDVTHAAAKPLPAELREPAA